MSKVLKICADHIRDLYPDPRHIERELLWARLTEHAQTCRRTVEIPRVGSVTETKCCKDSPCFYRQEIERQLDEMDKPKEVEGDVQRVG